MRYSEPDACTYGGAYCGTDTSPDGCADCCSEREPHGDTYCSANGSAIFVANSCTYRQANGSTNGAANDQPDRCTYGLAECSTKPSAHCWSHSSTDTCADRCAHGGAYEQAYCSTY